MLRELILAEHRRGATVLFSTHVMPQAEEICDHVVMIHRGRKVLDDPVRAILRPHDSRALEFEPLDRTPTSRRARVARGRALRRGRRAATRWRCAKARRGARACSACSPRCPSRASSSSGRSLEDVFVAIVAGAGGRRGRAPARGVAA